MAVLNTQATNKTRIIPNLPDTGSGYILATLISHVAISTADEVFQGGERVSKGQTYRCTLNASGDPDSTVHPTSLWYLPTPDVTGAAGWLYTFEAVDSSNNRRYLATATVAYSASAQQLADILAAGIADNEADSTTILLANYLPLAGGTMTGQLNFSGTTHAGIKLLSLTTAERDALTPAEGMEIYNETEQKVQVYQGAAWVSVGAASTPALDDITDVTITGPVADNELLARSDANSDWRNKTAAEAGVATAADLTSHTGNTSNPHSVTAAQAGAEPAGTVATHEADTTNVHGIADTSALVTSTDLGNHVSDTTNVHGIGDTSALLDTADVDVTIQSYSAKTAAIAALTWAANNIILLTGAATAAVQALAAHVVTFIQSASAADARAAIGLIIGTDVQAYDAELAAIAGLTSAADKLPYFTGAATAGVADLTSFARTILDDVAATDVTTTIGAARKDTDNSFSAIQTVSLTGTGAAVVVSRSDGVASALQAGASSCSFLYDTAGVFSIERRTNAQVKSGTSSTGDRVLSIQGSGVTTPLIGIGLGADNPTVPLEMRYTLTADGSNHDFVKVDLRASGAPSAGFGAGVLFQLKSSTTGGVDAARLKAFWSETTHASRKGAIALTAYDVATEREGLRIGVNGSAATIGFLGAAPVTRAAHIADSGGDDATAVNAILVVLENLGFIATS